MAKKKSKKIVRKLKKKILSSKKKKVVLTKRKIQKKIKKIKPTQKKKLVRKKISRKIKNAPKLKFVSKTKNIKRFKVKRFSAKPKRIKNNLVKRIVRRKKTIKKTLPKKSFSKRRVLRTKNKEEQSFQAEALFKARIKVIGVGGGGGSIVSEIGKSLQKATFVVADTDVRALKKRPGIKYFLFGQELTHGLGTGVDIELAKKTGESAKERASELFRDQDIVIFIASLGGGLGSGATQVFAETAKQFGGITLGIFTMPFKFEGANKQRIALNALKVLKQSLNVSMVIPNERIFKVIDENTPITDAFSMVNKNLIESLESLINLIYSPGIINIDFADLKTILRGLGNSAFLNTVVEGGKDRADKICKGILINPLLQSSGFEVEKILFNISGADNLSMFEVEKISTHIANLHPKAKIIFGISKNPKLKNKIKTTILMTGGGTKEKIIKTEVLKEKPIEVAKEVEVVKQKSKVKIKAVDKKSSIKVDSKPKGSNLPKAEEEENKIKIEKKEEKEIKNTEAVPFMPPVKEPEKVLPALEQRKMVINQLIGADSKKTIRRSGLEIKKAEEREEKKRIAQEKEWEIPAFLRRVKKI